MAWGRVRAAVSTILMKNKKNHEPNSPAAILFLLILCKVHHINELILVQKTLLELTAFVVFSLCSFLLWVLAAKWNLLKSWWPCGAGASVNRIWVNSSLLPALEAEHTGFPVRTPHLGMQENTDGQRQPKSWVMRGKKWSGKRKEENWSPEKERREARKKQPGHRKEEV